MDRPIPTANPELARYVKSRVEALDARRDAKVAEHFSCDRRTVHRHLADCGTTFSKILDGQRGELATRLIADRTKPLAMIAKQLGFSAQSALARWFRHRFGCSIRQWRRGDRLNPVPRS